MAAMRVALAVLGVTLLLAEVHGAFARARQPEDGDDGDAADDDASQIAEQVSSEEEAGPQPANLAQQNDQVVPAPSLYDHSGAHVSEGTIAAAVSGELKLPGKVSIPASLNSFGKKEHGGAMPVSLKNFGAEEAKPTREARAEADAKNADIAAMVAKHAAKVAGKVATHSLHVTESAKSALKDAQDALYKARVETKHLSSEQKHTLEVAEGKLKAATKNADEEKAAKATKTKGSASARAAEDAKKRQMLKEKMQRVQLEQAKKREQELEAMRQEIKDLRKELKQKEGDKAEDDAVLKELQDSIEEMEKNEKVEDKSDQKTHDDMKAEIDKLREEIKGMDNQQANVTYVIPATPAQPPAPAEAAAVAPPAPIRRANEAKETEKYKVKMQPLSEDEDSDEEPTREGRTVTPVQQKGLDIDTAMPYGDLEPFGREDTAQELTENSITESDEMVDQLERAEVAEEKRSVFRALTRLRGAAITSFDGVARSQTGNIDEYNKVHKWRNNHPLHHLADEESDISKWAFPDNAD